MTSIAELIAWIMVMRVVEAFVMLSLNGPLPLGEGGRREAPEG